MAGQTSLCYDADFYPFGGEMQITTTCSQNYKFEGKERDTETGNDAPYASRMMFRDDFGARYYSSVYGRWLSADWSSVPAPVPYANMANPQTLNLYAMVSDNPETFADLDGHTPQTPQAQPIYGCNADIPNGCPPPNDDTGQASQNKTNTSAADQAVLSTQSTTNTVVAAPKDQNEGDKKSDQPPPSWTPDKPLPKDPSGLGPDWRKNDDHKNPNGEQWVNDKTGEKVEFDKGRPGQTGEKANDHWHYTPPGGDKGKDHIKPGDVLKRFQDVGAGVVRTIREHPLATGVAVATVAIAATILTGGAAAPSLAFAF